MKPIATMKGLFALSLLPLLTAASPIRHATSEPKLIPNSYIVIFKDHVSSDAATVHHSWVQDLHAQTQQAANLELRKRSQFPIVDSFFKGLKHTYDISGLLGYSGHFDDAVIEQIRKNPDVSLQYLR